MKIFFYYKKNFKLNKKFMKFKIDKDKFLDAISIVWRVVWTNWTLPILENIYLKISDWKIYFFATNLDLEISYFIDEVEIQEEWEITVPSKLLQSYLNLLNSWIVEFQVKWEDILLKSKSWKTKIKWLSAKDFPKNKFLKTENNFSINSKNLKTWIIESVFSVSWSMSRPFLTWINFKIDWSDPTKLIMMSTDSYRFTQKKINLNTENSNLKWDYSIIVPANTSNEISKLISDRWMIWWDDFYVNVSFSDDQILFELWNIKLSSRLISWKFPDCTMLIPKSKSLTVVLQRQDFMQLVKRVNIFAKENNNNLKISFSEESQEIQINTMDTLIWSDESTLEASIKWEDLQISLNSEFLLAILNIIKNDSVVVELNWNYSPILFKNPEDDSFLHIIMPLRV